MSVPKSERTLYEKEYISSTIELIKKTIWLVSETHCIDEKIKIVSDRLLETILNVQRYILQADNQTMDTHIEAYSGLAKASLQEYNNLLSIILQHRDSTIKITTIQDMIKLSTDLVQYLENWHYNRIHFNKFYCLHKLENENSR